MSEAQATWSERAVEFGSSASLRGIVTTAVPSTEGDNDVFLVIFNAGVIHRVGPNRLSVKLARNLAPDVLPSLRFDFSGLGDSPPRTDTKSIDDSIALDVSDALDFLTETYGAREFVTLGLCSGGRESFRAAYRDRRVRAAVAIDPYAYRTWGFVMRHLGPRLLRARSWRTVIVRRKELLRALGSLLRPERAPAPVDTEICGLPERPTRSGMRAALDEVLARGTELLFVHTAGLLDYYNYSDQFRDAFSRQFAHENLHYEYMPDANHTFSSEDARLELIRRLRSWFSQIGVSRATRTPVARSGS